MKSAGDALFARGCRFVASADKVAALLPPDRAEVALAGRSNVGKSSLINALTGQNGLARVSHTPGRTQMLNFFDLAGQLYLVDMPGYGYAKVAKELVAGWQQLIKDYLRGRVVLRRVLLLVDSRHGLKPVDKEIFALLDECAVPYQIVLTKSDELKPPELTARLEEVTAQLKKHPAAMPQVLAVSSHSGAGLSALRDAIAELV